MTYLTECLNNDNATAIQVFNYANVEPYTLTPSIINSLGVAVSTMEDMQQKELKAKFYKLAADGGNARACINYAKYMQKRNLNDAIVCGAKAVELEREDAKKKKHEGFVLCGFR